jgi:hypothetical protein
MAASERSMRKIGLVADSAWASLVDGLGRLLLVTDVALARDACLRKSHVWARRHADAVSELLSTSPAERAGAAAVVQVAGLLARRLGLSFTVGDVLLPGKQKRRLSKLGVARGPAGCNAFRGSSDGAGFFTALPPGHPLRLQSGKVQPRFRFQLKCSSLSHAKLVKYVDKELLPAESSLRREMDSPDATFSTPAVRKALQGADFLVMLVVTLPGFGRGVSGQGHADATDLAQRLLSKASAHWAILSDGATSRHLFDHTGVFTTVARRRLGMTGHNIRGCGGELYI